MRRLPLALAAVLSALVVACAAPAAPGWTYAPAPSVTPAPSVEASGAPAASASAAASPSATAKATATPKASGSARPSGSPGASGGTGLTIIAPVGASTAGFNTDRLEAEAGIPFTITFENQDTGVPHNFVLKKPDGSNVPIGDTAITTGPATVKHNVPALNAGEYPFLCEVHPNTMKGVLTVG
jgi:plastocyanin